MKKKDAFYCFYIWIICFLGISQPCNAENTFLNENETPSLKEFFWKSKRNYPGDQVMFERVESFLGKRWTPTRISEFLNRPEIKGIRSTSSKGKSGNKTFSGQLKSFGNDVINWTAILERGIPKKFVIERTNPFVLLEDEEFSTIIWNEDDFKKHMFTTILQNALGSYYDSIWNSRADTGCLIDKKKCRLIRNGKGDLIKVEFIQSNSNTLTAELDSHEHIASLNSRGHCHTLWEKVFEIILKTYITN